MLADARGYINADIYISPLVDESMFQFWLKLYLPLKSGRNEKILAKTDSKKTQESQIEWLESDCLAA